MNNASLDFSRLENVRPRNGKTEARCPACAEGGNDNKGEHLTIYEDGKFGCVMFPGDKEHRKRIFELAGNKSAGPVDARPVCTDAAATRPRKPKKVYPNEAALQVSALWVAEQRLGKGAKLAGVYPYNDTSGKTYAIVYRYDLGADKYFVPCHAAGGGWSIGDPSKWYPYRVDELSAGGTVYIVEGEKCTEAATLIGLSNVITSVHGSKSANKTDWSALAGRDAVILPDNDEAGASYANEVARMVLNQGGTARIAKMDGMKGYDIADLITDQREAGKADAEIIAYIEKLAGEATRIEATKGPQIVVKNQKPWQSITAEQVEETIQGTALAPIVRACAAPMEPGLPIAVTLPKALCLAGCALSGPDNSTENIGKLIARGHRKARFRIMTAGGQVCNVWAIIAVESGGGKDVGGVVNDLAYKQGYSLGDAGTAEGLADALIENGNGLITISELQNWLDEKHWQGKAAPFLTAAFNSGSFLHSFSRRQGGDKRDCPYCYPSIIANVQPATLARYATTSGIDSGFMGRFLFTSATAHYGRPTCRDMSHLIEDAAEALTRYEQKAGTLEVADGYLGETFAMFRDNEAPLPSTWKRLVNEYGPRLAVMLSVDNADGGTEVTVKPRHWDGAAIIIQWLYGHAEELLGRISDDPDVKRMESIMGRLEKYIVRHPGCTKSDLSRNCSTGNKASERNAALAELIERGQVSPSDDNRFYPAGG